MKSFKLLPDALDNHEVPEVASFFSQSRHLDEPFSLEGHDREILPITQLRKMYDDRGDKGKVNTIDKAKEAVTAACDKVIFQKEHSDDEYSDTEEVIAPIAETSGGLGKFVKKLFDKKPKFYILDIGYTYILSGTHPSTKVHVCLTSCHDEFITKHRPFAKFADHSIVIFGDVCDHPFMKKVIDYVKLHLDDSKDFKYPVKFSYLVQGGNLMHLHDPVKTSVPFTRVHDFDMEVSEEVKIIKPRDNVIHLDVVHRMLVDTVRTGLSFKDNHPKDEHFYPVIPAETDEMYTVFVGNKTGETTLCVQLNCGCSEEDPYTKVKKVSHTVYQILCGKLSDARHKQVIDGEESSCYTFKNVTFDEPEGNVVVNMNIHVEEAELLHYILSEVC